MSNARKILNKMRQNHQNWRIEHFETIAPQTFLSGNPDFYEDVDLMKNYDEVEFGMEDSVTLVSTNAFFAVSGVLLNVIQDADILDGWEGSINVTFLQQGLRG